MIPDGILRMQKYIASRQTRIVLSRTACESILYVAVRLQVATQPVNWKNSY